MTAKADAEIVRSAFSTPNDCTSDTVTTLRRLLNVHDGNKENLQSGPNIPEKGAAAAAAPPRHNGTAKALKERQIVKAKQKLPSECLTIKEQQNLATELVNKTLKILTEAARSSGTKDAKPTEKTPKARLKEARMQKPTDKLASVATCSRIAFATLRRIRESAPGQSNTQLEQGMIALIGKLLSLELYTHAEKELLILQQTLQTPTCLKGSSASRKADSPSSTLILTLPDSSLPRLSLAMQYQTLLLRLWNADPPDLDEESLVKSTDPDTIGSPSWILAEMRSAGANASETARSLEIIAQLIKSISRSSSKRIPISTGTAFQLDMHALRIRRQWWAMSGHQINLIREVIEPVRSSLKSLTTSPSLKSAEQHLLVQSAFAHITSWEMFNNMAEDEIRHYNKLLALTSEIAASSGNFSERQRWLPASDARDASSQASCAIRDVLLNLRKEPLPNERALVRLKECLQSCHELPKLASDTEEAVSAARRTLCACLVKKPSSPPDLQMLICRCLFSCLQIWSRCPDRKTPATSFVESGILASSIWLKTFAAKDVGLQELLKAQKYLRSIASALRTDSDKKLLLAMSELQWRIYHYCRRGNGPSEGNHDVSDVLLGAVAPLRDLSLEDRSTANIAGKLIELATSQMQARMYRESRQSLSDVVSHLSDGGFLRSLTGLLESMPVLRALEQIDSGSEVLEAIALARQLSRDSKRTCLQELTTNLSEEESTIFQYIWLMIPPGQPSDYPQGDLDTCVCLLLDRLTPITYPIRRLQVLQRALTLAVSFPSTTSLANSPPCSVLNASLGRDAGLAKYVEHLQHSWNFAQALRRTDSKADVFTQSLSYWSEVSRSDALKNDIDDPEYLLQLLISACPLLELKGYFALAELALRICEVLCETAKHLQDKFTLLVKLARCRIAIRQGNTVKANLCLAGLPKNDGDMRLHTRLELAEIRLKLSSISSDPRGMHETLSDALAMTSTSGLRRHEKMQVYDFQSNIGLSMAAYLGRTGQFSLSAQVARASLLLLRSIIASDDRQKADNHTNEVITSNNVAAVTDSLSRLELSGLIKGESTSEDIDAASDPCMLARIFDCTLLLSRIALSQGNGSEARYYLEQATRSIKGPNSMELTRRLAAETLQLQVFSGFVGNELYDPFQDPPCVNAAQQTDVTASAWSLACGDWSVRFKDVAEALDQYALAEKFLVITDNALGHESQAQAAQPVRPTTTTTKKSVPQTKRPSKLTQKTVRKTAKKLETSLVSSEKRNLRENVTLKEERFNHRHEEMLERIFRQRSLALLKGNDLSAAKDILDKLSLPGVPSGNQQLSIAHTRLRMAMVRAKLMTDVNYSTLPESTLAIPSAYRAAHPDEAQGQGTTPNLKSVATKHPRSKSLKAESMQSVLNEANRHISLPAKTTSLQPLPQVYEISSLSVSTDMLRSAVSECKATELHPCEMAHMLEMSANEASRRQVLEAGMDGKKANLIELLQKAKEQDSIQSPLSAATFQDDFVDLLPDNWTVISLSMNEEGTEIWAARYNKNTLPFISRLPMARSRDTELEEDSPFNYSTAKQELIDVIKQSDYSCHHPPDPSVKGGKSKWWEEREALDARMHDLLSNIENIWFGGFKGVLSSGRSPSDLLARFQKSFEAILDRHLPSRRAVKAKREKVALHAQILELFVKLAVDTDVDIDDHIMDLLFFIVDILRYNGEPNAYDEIDLDAMAIETLDAISAYHSAAGSPETDDSHIVLRLDKRLHCFPWESIPCLQGISVSRVASLLQVRERVLAMRSGRSTISQTKGTYILNPSGDLSRTEATLLPALAHLDSKSWTPVVRTKPDESAFTSALSSSNALLYFGHGSGAQYVRPRAIERLETCAPAVWLMGCSSGLATEYGQLETTSVPLSYLTAGKTDVDTMDYWTKGRDGLCMAVVATLWDVTDRDIDKFSLAVGEKWGLFESNGDEVGMEAVAVPKTLGRKRKEAMTKTPGKTPGRNRKAKTVDEGKQAGDGNKHGGMSLSEAVAKSRDVCYLRYLNGAASVVYGVPVYLEK
ncbi:hypothetical protein K461DRAFT_276085 [Myriangium duriaei CBS 260.36]|uniref:separase n=1 Tax=Myriangium duriaei CBS 260.36 TaxID=1168546 RepID=A0A9P4MJ65_9PEZI|nr:hypothetical protein K461DRAFT_276085 [Myriangium duriaei CBS 260.36]